MASPPQPATQLQPGDVVADRYVVMRLLGRGGMGEVYEAVDSKLERGVALKIVVAAASVQARRRLEAEAKAVAALEHPGIVTLHDVLEHGDLVVLVLELVQGRSLRDMLDMGPLEPRMVARVISGVAEALEAAHQRGFVHRDVKPDNVVMRPDGRTVLLDFGIAKGPTGGSPMAVSVTAAGALLGTPAYLAPEQIRDEPVSAASDQFALAVTAFELCTGLLPWNAASVSAIIASIVSDAPRRFHEPAVEDDAEIEAVFAKALHKQPEQRYPSVSAFADALGAVLGSQGARGDADPSQSEAERAERRARDEMRTLTAPVDGRASTIPAPAAAPTAPRSRRRLASMALGTLLLAGGALWIGTSLTRAPSETLPSASSSAAAEDVTSAISLPDELPASGAQSEEDRTAYRDAIRALRLGNIEGATRQLDATIKQSPGFAGAQLMRSYASFLRAFDLDEPARVAFRAASAQRDLLSARDAALLDALAPSFLDPPRWRESAALLEKFVGERPGDVLGWEVLGFARTKLGDYAAAEIAFAKEIELDPRAGLAYDLEAQFAIVRRDDASAKALLETCTRQVPAAIRCRVDASVLLADTGQCAEADREARDALAIDPDSSRALVVRARATAALGAPNEVVAGFLEKRRKLVPKGLLRAVEIEDAYLLAKRSGDFTAALAAVDSSFASDPALNGADISRVAMVRVETLWETGEKHEAVDIARRYLRLEATRTLPERGTSDPTGRMLRFLREAGDITPKDHDARRDAWLAAWRARRTETEWKTEVGFDLWASSYAAIATPNAQEAHAAIEAAQKLGIDIEPRGSVNGTATDLDASTLVGSLLLAADRLDEAETMLRAAAHRCAIAPDQVARFALGQLLVRRGDKAGACATFAEIERDWGKAKPRSITAEAGRAAAKKVGCASAK